MTDRNDFTCPWCNGTCNEPEKTPDEPCQLCSGQGRLKLCDRQPCDHLIPSDMYYCCEHLMASFRVLA